MHPKSGSLVLLLLISTAGFSQLTTQKQKDSVTSAAINPLLMSAFKKTDSKPTFRYRVVRRPGEIMHWPSYPLTTGQIIARNEEWQRRNNMSVGEQIASDIIRSNVNRLIYGRKPAPAVIPRF